MKGGKDGLIIILFAIAHAATALVCRALLIDDSIILTILTMILTVIICIRERLNIEFTAVNVILVNIIGYLLGITIAKLLKMLTPSPLAVHSISTFITTEVLGWGVIWFSRMFPDNSGKEEDARVKEIRVKWLILASAGILVIRILIGVFLATDLFADGTMLDLLSAFMSNSVVLLIMVSTTILFIQYLHREKTRFGTLDTFIALFVFFLISISLSALLVGYGIPITFEGEFTFGKFLGLAAVAMICEAAIYSFIYIIDYALTARRIMETERARANLAKAQYINLKQQVNPHFLFNSLNALDFLVEDNENEKARDYIQKLAGIYRYMLNKESEPVVTLKEEIEYVEMYTELLKLRFQDGLEIFMDIRKGDLSRYVVPYSVQMLIENATKHNTISKDKPLRISLTSDGEVIRVKNNLAPKIDKPSSTGIGLKYIHKNYIDRGRKDIIISNDGKDYSVSLPLL